MIFAAIALSIAGIAAFSILPVMIGAVADAQGLDSAQAGYVAAADLCGFALAAIASALWSGRIKGRQAAAAGLLAALAGNLLSLHSPHFTILLGARGLAGIGEGAMYAVAISSLARSVRSERNFGIMVAAQIVFQVVALFVLPNLVGIWGPDAIFLALAGITALAVPGLLRWDASASTPPLRPAGEVRRLTRWLPLGAMALFSVNLGAMWTYVERIGVGAGLSSAQTGSLLAVALALSVLGALVASWLGERWGRRLPLIVAVAVQLVAIVLFSGPAGVAAYATGAVLYSVAWAFAVPYLYTLVASLDDSGRMIMLAPAAQAIGAGLGPAAAASMLNGTSYVPIYALAAVALVGTLVCMLCATQGGHATGRHDT